MVTDTSYSDTRNSVCFDFEAFLQELSYRLQNQDTEALLNLGDDFNDANDYISQRNRELKTKSQEILKLSSWQPNSWPAASARSLLRASRCTQDLWEWFQSCCNPIQQYNR